MSLDALPLAHKCDDRSTSSCDRSGTGYVAVYLIASAHLVECGKRERSIGVLPGWYTTEVWDGPESVPRRSDDDTTNKSPDT